MNLKAFAHHGKLAFVSRGVLWLLDGNSGSLRRLPTPGGSFTPAEPMFSADGRWLAYLETKDDPVFGTNTRVWIAHADGSGSHVVSGFRASGTFGWSPTNDLLAVAAGPERVKAPCPCYSPTTLRLVSPDGSSRVLMRAAWLQGAAWSPDGGRIAAFIGASGQASTIAVYPIAGGSRTVWLALRRHDRLNGMNQIVMSPAGWWRGAGIGFWVFGDGMVHNNDETPLDLLAAPRAHPQLLASTLSDQTTKVVAANGKGGLAIVADISHGFNGGRVVWDKKQVQLCSLGAACRGLVTSRSKVTVDPAWSSDGRTLAFVQAPDFTSAGWPQRFLQRWYQDHELRLYSSRTRRLRTVASAKGASVPSWSPDGRSLLYVAGDGLWLLPTLAATPVEIATPLFPPHHWPAYYGQVAWTAQFAWWSS